MSAITQDVGPKANTGVIMAAYLSRSPVGAKLQYEMTINQSLRHVKSMSTMNVLDNKELDSLFGHGVDGIFR